MAEPPSDPVEREGVRNHREVEGEYTHSRLRRDRAEDSIKNAQGHGCCSQRRSALHDERHQVRNQFMVARQNSRSDQFQALIGNLHHIRSDGLPQSDDPKDLYPKIAGYVREQDKGRDSSEDLARRQSNE